MSTLAAGSPVARCENIGPKQRARRVRIGSLLLGCSLLLATELLLNHAARPLRLTLFFPLLGASIGFLQVRERTCVMLAARDLKNMDDGDKLVTDPEELRRIATQSRRVIWQSLVIALVLTVAFWLA